MNPARTERYKDLLLAAVLLLVAISGFVYINPTGADVTDGPGGLSWRTMPFIYSGILVGLVALFIASTLYDLWLIKHERPPRAIFGERPVVEGDSVSNGRRVLVVICLFAYAASIKAFGFAIATLALLFIMLRVLGRRQWLRNLVISVVGTALLWLLFVGILKLPLSGEVWDPVTPVLNAIYVMTGAR